MPVSFPHAKRGACAVLKRAAYMQVKEMMHSPKLLVVGPVTRAGRMLGLELLRALVEAEVGVECIFWRYVVRSADIFTKVRG